MLGLSLRLPLPAVLAEREYGLRPLLQRLKDLDPVLLVVTACLLVWGLAMVASASVAVAEENTGNTLYYFYRQLAYAALGLGVAWFVFQIELESWKNNGFLLLAVSMLLLLIVFLPALGHTVNGAQRWVNLGIIKLQVSEPARLFLVIYLASYIVRRRTELSLDFWGMVKPMVPISVAGALMLLQPDYGAVAILLAVTMITLFLAGARILHSTLLVGTAAAGLAFLAITSPYRLRRLTSFSNPWEDPYNSGFQLSQALIAIGRGEWSGVGFGNSVQKLMYLPETHTDFVYAVLAEEFGLLGSLCLLGLFGLLIWRGFVIAGKALENGLYFGGYMAYALASWIGLQAFINIAVNMGVLPTKGLTLPLMSYGGSSLVVVCVLIALLLRVDFETRRFAGESKAAKQRREAREAVA
ncbi:MAG: putative lipid II flippase FtsW [Salinisphaeraceae bacterium]|nr:putative lipid II flippase FtsW [Salinisphaeraceae bacterium]